ncbi:hypothetical protein F5884DRAFT_778844 [Xylogone sp. PMI_703]|nr:hypothetical protein F5884DRAFT_778844 [Xylogone sp. PMI_703]
MAPQKIDAHAHITPDFLTQAMIEAGHGKPDGMPAIPPWDEKLHLQFMEDAGIKKSYLSVSSPGVTFEGDISKAKVLARRANEFVAGLQKRHPGKFGSFAALPMPDVNGCLEEIAYSLDVLKADGFTMLSSYRGVYLGDKVLKPIFKELNRRKAKVFLHPTTPCPCVAGNPQPFKPLSLPNPVLEFFFDAARAVVDLIVSGTVTSNPDITFIIPHCGGVLPPLIDRFTFFSSKILLSGDGPTITAEEIQNILRNRFYYDLAGFSMGNQIHGLLRWTGPSQLLYGTDFPYTPAEGIAYQAVTMDQEAKKLWSTEEIEGVYFKNAEKLFNWEF